MKIETKILLSQDDIIEAVYQYLYKKGYNMLSNKVITQQVPSGATGDSIAIDTTVEKRDNENR